MSTFELTSGVFITAIISRPDGGQYRSVIRSLQETPGDLRHIDSVLTDDNLRMLGLIETNQSTVVKGLAKSAPRAKKKTGAAIREMSDDERTPNDTGLEAGFPKTGKKQKGKAVVPKFKRRKSVIVSRSIPGIISSDSAICQPGNIFAGLDDVPIPECVSLYHESGSVELREALNISELLPVSAVDTSGWSGALRICIHFHNTT